MYKYYLNLVDKATSKIMGLSSNQVFTSMCDLGDNYLVTCPDLLVNLQRHDSAYIGVYNPTVARQLVLRVSIGSKVKLQVRRGDTNATVESDIMCYTLGRREECELYFQAVLPAYSLDYYLIGYHERDTPKVYTVQ